MATKRELSERWTNETGKRVLEKIESYFESLAQTMNTPQQRYGKPAELARIVQPLPFTDEVESFRDLRGLPIWSRAWNFDFTGWDFSYARLQFNFAYCVLSNAIFDGATSCGFMADCSAERASFIGANLSGASLREIIAHGCNFDKATLRSTRFDRSDLTGSSFVNAKAQSANFAGATLLGCNFQGAKLNGAIITTARIDKSTDLRGASLVDLVYQEHRNQFGELMWPENDWRQATHDGTTIYGEHPAVHEQELLKALLALMKEQNSADARAIATELRKAKAVILKDPDNWIESVFSAITTEQRMLLESAMFDAVKMVE